MFPSLFTPKDLEFMPNSEWLPPVQYILTVKAAVSQLRAVSLNAGHLRSCNCFVGSLNCDTNCTVLQSTSYIAVA